MKFAVVSNLERAKEIFQICVDNNIFAFIFKHADPDQKLINEKFVYVSSDREIAEKIALLNADFTLSHSINFKR